MNMNYEKYYYCTTEGKRILKENAARGRNGKLLCPDCHHALKTHKY